MSAGCAIQRNTCRAPVVLIQSTRGFSRPARTSSSSWPGVNCSRTPASCSRRSQSAFDRLDFLAKDTRAKMARPTASVSLKGTLKFKADRLSCRFHTQACNTF